VVLVCVCLCVSVCDSFVLIYEYHYGYPKRSYKPTDDQLSSYESDYVIRDKLLLHELHRRIDWTIFNKQQKLSSKLWYKIFFSLSIKYLP